MPTSWLVPLSGSFGAGGAGDTVPPSAPVAILAGRTTTTLTFEITVLATDNITAQSGLNYPFRYKKITDSSWSESILNAPVVVGSQHTITGLAQNTAYHITVHAKDAAGNYSLPGSIFFVTTGTTLPRFHAEDIIAYIVNLIATNLQGTLGLKHVIRGDLSHFTQIAAKLNNDLPIVFVTLNNHITFEPQTLTKYYDVVYGIRILYIRRFVDSEQVEKKDYSDIKEIVELLISDFALPNLTLTNAQVVSSNAKEVQFNPDEDDFNSDQRSDMTVSAIDFDVLVRTKRNLTC